MNIKDLEYLRFNEEIKDTFEFDQDKELDLEDQIEEEPEMDEETLLMKILGM